MASSLSAGATAAIPPTNPIYASVSSPSTPGTIYTVPAGKVFYCTAAQAANASGTNMIYRITVDGTPAVYLGSQAGSVSSVSGTPLLFTATAGKVIKGERYSGADFNIIMSIQGYLL